jgi:hypothetical protein
VRLTLGDVTFEVKPMRAGVLEDHAQDLETYLNIQPGKLALTAQEVAAMLALAGALARQAGASFTREQLRELIDTSNLGEVNRAIGLAYVGQPRAEDQAPGEAPGPSASTGTG